MELQKIIPWGRSLKEYTQMFALTKNDLEKTILGCADGPASFNAELIRSGGRVISVDPMYSLNAAQIRRRIQEVYPEVMEQLAKNTNKYLWTTITNFEELGIKRMEAMEAFLADYDTGKQEKRYIKASLPKLPFQNKQFQLALCSHYLFLYSEHQTFAHHLESIQEICRVAEEVRIYPLLTLQGEPSPYLVPVMEKITNKGITPKLAAVSYQFQKGATEMLTLQ